MGYRVCSTYTYPNTKPKFCEISNNMLGKIGYIFTLSELGRFERNESCDNKHHIRLRDRNVFIILLKALFSVLLEKVMILDWNMLNVNSKYA